MNFHAHMTRPDGTPYTFLCPDARRFSYYVNGVQFWFAIHAAPGTSGHSARVVSHWGSGRKVCDVPASSLGAAVGMPSGDIGRAALARLCEDKGEARVHDVLRRAETYRAGVAA